MFHLTDCSGSTYNLILPQLYVKDFSGDTLHQITNALSVNLNRLIGPAVQSVKSWVLSLPIFANKANFAEDPVMQSLRIPPCCSDHHSCLVWAFIFSGLTSRAVWDKSPGLYLPCAKIGELAHLNGQGRKDKVERRYLNSIQAFESGLKGLWNQVLLLNVNLLYGSFNQV